jgi:glutathione S-transferase
MSKPIKLFFSKASPFVRKVTIVGAMRGLTDRIDSVSTDATKGDPALNAANPLGKLPCLIADGMVIHDSHVICEYLDQLATAGQPLFPKSGPERWRTLTLASLADGILDAALIMVYERRYRPDNMVVQSWLDRQQGKIDAALAQLEQAPPAWTSQPDYGHVTLACALGYLDFRHAGRWRASNPALVAWLDRFDAAVPAFKATTPVG